MNQLLVATGNPHKLAEISQILADLEIDIIGLDRLPAGPEVPETGATFVENARIKALEYARRAAELPEDDRPRWVIADDSGLCVSCLDGAPGVFSARYAGEGCSYEDNNRKLLAALEGRLAGERGARFVTAIVCAQVPAGPDEPALDLFHVVGECEGRILDAPRGEHGFGYDPIFLHPASGKTFAELPATEKNRISHRAEALRAFHERFRTLLDD